MNLKNLSALNIECHPDQNTSQKYLLVIILILPVFHNLEANGNS